MNKLRRLKISALLALALTCSQGSVFAAFGGQLDPNEEFRFLVGQALNAQRTLETSLQSARDESTALRDATKKAADEMRITGAQVKQECRDEASRITSGIADQATRAIQDQINPILQQARQHENNAAQQAQEAQRQQLQAETAARRAQKAHDEMPGIFQQKIADANAQFIKNQQDANSKMVQENEAATKRNIDYETQQVALRKETELQQEFNFKEKVKEADLQRKIDEQKAMLQGQRELEQMKADMAEAAEMRLAQNPDLQKSRQEMEAVKAAATKAAAYRADVKAAEIQAKSAERQMALKIKGLKSIMGSIGAGLRNKKTMGTIGLTIAGTSALYIAAKHGIPLLFDALVQPKVVSETSKQSLFGSTVPSSESTVDELTFAPALQNALNAIAMQLKTAQQYNENLPNILFAGPPGTGKTAFAKAIARIKDAEGENIFDYALTTGSQFIKIAVKDLNRATSELRKLIGWAKKGNKPMIIFIDEAEALFANRTSPDTPKYITDMINEFLGLVQDKSQKNISFIFATNHPFKLDDAILNRVGLKVEFTLPGTVELSKILKTYVNKFAQANPDALVKVAPEFMANLDTYAQALVGCAPRDVRFVAEQAISRARRSNPAVLTHNIALTMLKESQAELEKVARWEKERNDYRAKQQAIMVRG